MHGDPPGILSLPGEQALQLLLESPLEPSFFPVLHLLSVCTQA